MGPIGGPIPFHKELIKVRAAVDYLPFLLHRIAMAWRFDGERYIRFADRISGTTVT